MKINNIFKLFIAIAVSELAGIIGSTALTTGGSGSSMVWYSTLVKPALNPPAWIFGPVWTTLFALMGISAWLIWRKPDSGSPPTSLRVKIALAIFGFQLFLNTLWSIIFFGSTSLTINGLNNIGIALIEIVFLWLAILATIIAFYKISKPAAWLLAPYILWISFAIYLNYVIWALN